MALARARPAPGGLPMPRVGRLPDHPPQRLQAVGALIGGAPAAGGRLRLRQERGRKVAPSEVLPQPLFARAQLVPSLAACAQADDLAGCEFGRRAEGSARGIIRALHGEQGAGGRAQAGGGSSSLTTQPALIGQARMPLLQERGPGSWQRVPSLRHSPMPHLLSSYSACSARPTHRLYVEELDDGQAAIAPQGERVAHSQNPTKRPECGASQAVVQSARKNLLTQRGQPSSLAGWPCCAAAAGRPKRGACWCVCWSCWSMTWMPVQFALCLAYCAHSRFTQT